jgi:chitinase
MNTNPLMASVLTMNDDTNKISGLTTSHMFSKDNGSNWVAYVDESQNNFPGTVTVTVATKDDEAIKAVDYDAAMTYATPGTQVRYNGTYWTNAWYANAGEIPGSAEVWKRGNKVAISSLATFYFTPFSGQKAQDFQVSEKARVAAQRKIIGYFPEWGVYEAHNYFTPDKINYSQLTHLNYAFSIVQNGEAVVYDTWKGPELLPQVRKLTAQAGVTYMISFGGWSNTSAIEAAVATPAGIDKLIDSMIAFMHKYDFDGIDIDWEYPDSSTEKSQFTSLIQKLRSKLDAEGIKQDKYYQLSAAVTTNHNNVGNIDLAVTAPLFDSINVMAYDIHGAFDPITGHNAPLFANHLDSDPLLNVASTMQVYHETYGVPKSKLMMGIAYYGRGWGRVASTEKIAGLPGLFAAGSATVKGAWDDTDLTGTNPYYVLKEKLQSGAYRRYWDDESKVPYLYNAAAQEFLTYDDPESIQKKVDYILEQGFGGTIIWDISGDTSDHELGQIVAQLKDTVIDDGDGDGESGGDDTIIIGDISNVALNDAWADFDSTTFNTIKRYGVVFDISESDFSSGIYDICINGIVNVNLTKGKFTSYGHDFPDTSKSVNHNGIITDGLSTLVSGTVTVKTGRMPLNPDDVITIIQSVNGTKEMRAKFTVTRGMLEIGVVEPVEGLLNFMVSTYYSAWSGGAKYLAATIIHTMNSVPTYDLYLNDIRIAGLNFKGKSRGQEIRDQLERGCLTGTTNAYCTLPSVVFKKGDDLKLYETSTGTKKLVGQITVPESLHYGYGNY